MNSINIDSINLIDFKIKSVIKSGKSGKSVIKIPRIEKKIKIIDRNYEIVNLIKIIDIFCKDLPDSGKISVFKFYLAEDAILLANKILRRKKKIGFKNFYEKYLKWFCNKGKKLRYNEKLFDLNNFNSKNGSIGNY
jgi:hypothetical protein